MMKEYVHGAFECAPVKVSYYPLPEQVTAIMCILTCLQRDTIEQILTTAGRGEAFGMTSEGRQQKRSHPPNLGGAIISLNSTKFDSSFHPSRLGNPSTFESGGRHYDRPPPAFSVPLEAV